MSLVDEDLQHYALRICPTAANVDNFNSCSSGIFICCCHAILTMYICFPHGYGILHIFKYHSMFCYTLPTNQMLYLFPRTIIHWRLFLAPTDVMPKTATIPSIRPSVFFSLQSHGGSGHWSHPRSANLGYWGLHMKVDGASSA